MDLAQAPVLVRVPAVAIQVLEGGIQEPVLVQVPVALVLVRVPGVAIQVLAQAPVREPVALAPAVQTLPMQALAVEPYGVGLYNVIVAPVSVP